MKWFEQTYDAAAENLAADEALLDFLENLPGTGPGAPGPGVLRFYEPARPFVVVGYGNRLSREVNLEACLTSGVPVLRRSSGGGAVVLGPGCLAYSLVLPVTMAPELESVTGTNRLVMERHRAAVESILREPVRVQGFTDLVLGGMKFSGNSQRRRRQAILFHGTFLLDFDLVLIGRLLHPPSQEPEYRRGRPHREFLVNLGVPSEMVKRSLRAAWGATEPWTGSIEMQLANAMADRFGRPEWHARS